MSKTYDKSNIEIKAKELLSPIVVSCPDDLWQELSLQLNEHNTRNQNTWTNKLYTPKTLALAMVFVAAVAVFLMWKLTGGAGDLFSHKAAAATVQKPQPESPTPVNNNFLAGKPAQKPVKDTISHTINNAPAKDTIKKNVPATAINVPGGNNVQNLNTPVKIDTAAQRRYYYMRLAYRHRHDSVAAAKKDSIARVTARRTMHDSLRRVATDSAGN